MRKMTLKKTRELDVFCKENYFNCTKCERLFLDGDCAHLGYLNNGDSAFLCDNCSVDLKETVIRYCWSKNVYESPDPTDKLWRYMDLSKFISLLSKQELYFSVASCFDDPFEGAKGISTKKHEWDDFYLDFFQKAIVTAPGMDLSTLTSKKLENESKRLLSEMSLGSNKERTSTFINCWHLNDFESEAMWKLYSKDVTNAIAIQSTYIRLYEALNKDPYIDIGKIKYIDFSKQFAPVNGSFWFKRKSFEHENEVRAVLTRRNENITGVGVPIIIDTLIENIFISPYAPIWFTEVVKSVLEKYNFNKPVLQSDMSMQPFY